MPKKSVSKSTKKKVGKAAWPASRKISKAKAKKRTKASLSKSAPAIQGSFMWKLLEQKKDQQKMKPQSQFLNAENKDSAFEPNGQSERWAKFHGHRRKVG